MLEKAKGNGSYKNEARRQELEKKPLPTLDAVIKQMDTLMIVVANQSVQVIRKSGSGALREEIAQALALLAEELLA